MSSIVRLARQSKLQKKKMVGNLDTTENETLSLKSEGIYVLPSWQRSLATRRASRPANRGIFRGEFILLRSSPPGTLSLKNRKVSTPNRNGHLYAQRNRPCPISLPLQKHEYPTRINQMDIEDDINPDDIERFFKQPLDVIPEYGNMESKENVYEVEEEDSSHDIDDSHHHSMPYPYTTQTLDRHFGLKEAQTSFSIWDRRPYRRTRPLNSSAIVDYSSDESGISTESGVSSHSDDDKNGYNPSSSDESGTSKHFSDSGDSALKDYYCISSDDEDLKISKRQKSEILEDIKEIKDKPEVVLDGKIDPQIPRSEDEVFPTGECVEDASNDHQNIKAGQVKQPKTNKRAMRSLVRKRSVSSSDEEAGDSLSPTFIIASTIHDNPQICEMNIDEAKNESPPIKEIHSTKDVVPSSQELPSQPAVTESLASVLQRSMMEAGDLKNTLRSRPMKDNTCKAIFNSTSLSRDNRRKSPRQSLKKFPAPPIPTSLPPSLMTGVSSTLPATLRNDLPLPLPPTSRNDLPTPLPPTLRNDIPNSLPPTLRNDLPNPLPPTLRNDLPTPLPPALRTEAPASSRPCAPKCLLPCPISKKQPTRLEVTRKGSFNSINDGKYTSERVQRSQSVSGYDLHKQIQAMQQFKVARDSQFEQKPSVLFPKEDTLANSKPETHHSTGDGNSDEEMYAAPKTAAKIKALQNVLMKQSLPFANPFLFKTSRIDVLDSLPVSNKEEFPKSTTQKEESDESGKTPPVPPPPPPPPATLPKVKKSESRQAKCVNYATTTKVQTGKEDFQLDDATRTRIASIKSMLERASNIDEQTTPTSPKSSAKRQSDGKTT